MKTARLWIPLLMTGLIVGCGQKGPLVLPDAPKHKKVVVPSPKTPAPGQASPSAPTPSGTPATEAPSGQTNTSTTP